MNARSFAILGVCSLLLTGCNRRAVSNQATAPGGAGVEVLVAKVGGESITLAEFEAELRRRAGGHPEAYASDEQRLALLNEMVEFEVLLARAKAAGYDRDPQVRAKVDQFIVSRFQEDQLAGQAASVTPSEAELREFYEQRRQQFATPESVRAAVIYFRMSQKATEEKRAELKRKAESVLAMARESDAANFSRLAQEYSEDQSTRYTGGDMGWFTLDAGLSQWNEAVVNAAFAIPETGQFAALVETPAGFYIIRLTDRKPGGVRPFDQVKDAIAYQFTQRLRDQRQVDFLKEMKRGIKVETYPDTLKLISVPVQALDSKPPPVPKS